MTTKGLHGIVLVLALFFTLHTGLQAAQYAFKDADLDAGLLRRVDALVRDMQDAGLPFVFDVYQLCAEDGKAVRLLDALSTQQAAMLFDQLDVHITSQQIEHIRTDAVHDELVERVYKHSPDGKARLRHLSTLRALFPDGGGHALEWQSFFARVGAGFDADPTWQFLVFHRATGLCMWIEMDTVGKFIP